MLRWATQADLRTLDPHAQNDSLTNSVNGHIFERLTARDEAMQLVPSLAKRWEQVAPLRWRFWLRRGVRFHGGEPFSADDVVFSIQRAQNVRSGVAQYARALGRVVKMDEGTVDFELSQPNPVFLDHVDAIFIVSQPWMTERGLQAPIRREGGADPGLRQANGTGPFRLVLREPDVQTVMERHRAHWAGPAHGAGNIARLVHHPISSNAARMAALLGGAVDLVTDPPASDLDALAANPRFRLNSVVENRVVFLGMDQDRARLPDASTAHANPFKDLRVRQALAHALNVPGLVQGVLRGRGQPALCLSPSPAACALAPELARLGLPHNPARARQLLADAGWAQGFAVTLNCQDRFGTICQAMAPMLERVGVRTQVQIEPATLFYGRLDRRDAHFYVLSWGGAEDDPQPTMDPLMHSWNAATGQGQENHGRFADAGLDALINAAGQESDPARRAPLLRQALVRHEAGRHHLTLLRPALSWVMRKDVRATPLPSGRVQGWMFSVRPAM